MMFLIVFMLFRTVVAMDFEAAVLRHRALSVLCPPGRHLDVKDCNTGYRNTCGEPNFQTLRACTNEVFCACPEVTLPDGECGRFRDCPSCPRYELPTLSLGPEDVRLVERMRGASDEWRQRYE